MATSPKTTTTTTTTTTSPASSSTAVAFMEKSWKQQLLSGHNLPEWTKSQATAITMPLTLPEKTTRPYGVDGPTACLFCDRIYTVPRQQAVFLHHLLEEHHFVIGDVNLVSDLPTYVDYWRSKFAERPPTEFCTVLKASMTEMTRREARERRKREGGARVRVEEAEPEARMQDFLFLSDVLQEDRQLRIHLQMKRLEQVLEVQERERTDKTFHRQCLFCRSEFTGSHADLYNHMASDHNFSVGQPDNLVFAGELLDVIDAKLNAMVCIFCEKTFKTREVLKEHMRKKGHKKINPRNRAYDKYYIVNYLEFGKNWEAISKEQHILGEEDDELPTGFDSDGGDDSDGASTTEGKNEHDWSDWRDDLSGAVCLFCPATYSTMDDLLTHMTSIHDFDFRNVRNRLKLDFYQQVKLINYVRRQVYLGQCIFCSEKCQDESKDKDGMNEELLRHMTEAGHMRVPEDVKTWDQPEYFFPTYENDNLLICLEDDLYDEPGAGSVPVVAEDDNMAANAKDSILREEGFRRSLCSQETVKRRATANQKK